MKAGITKSNDTLINFQQEEDCQMIEQVLVVIFAQEIINRSQKQLNRIDLAQICSLMFENCNIQMQMVNNDHNQQFNIIEQYITVDPILSNGYTKGILVAEVDQVLRQYLLNNPTQRKVIKDIDNDIVRVINFSFIDLRQIKQNPLFQNGKLEKNFINVHPFISPPDGSMFNYLNKFDGQIYNIKRIKLSVKPMWEDIYFNQTEEINTVKGLQKLNHPNIIRQYAWWLESVVENGGIKNYYINQQFEFFQQSDLLSFIFKYINHLKYNVKKLYIAQIFKQMCDGLKYLNQQGIFHRDIKPENIFVFQADQSDLIIKISGFEMAKCNKDNDGNILSTSYQTQLTGTEGYIGIKSYPNQLYDVTEEMYQSGMVLLDLCYLYERVVDRNYYHNRVLSGNPPSDFYEIYSIEFDLVKRLLNREFSDFDYLINSTEYQNLINQK